VVTGRHGQVASSLVELAQGVPGIEIVTLGQPDLDLEIPASVGPAILAAKPDLVVNAAAYTAVDRAEQEAPRAFAVNRDGAAAVAAAAAKAGVPLVHLSTDYVYSGSKSVPYVESDATSPLGIYGQSKLAGELAVNASHPHPLILRTSWVYSPFGSNFVRTMLRIGKERPEVGVVDDQTGNPTSALDLADAILRIAPRLVERGSEGGIYHLCGKGDVTWCGFARHIFAVSESLGGPHPAVRAITTADYPTPARRPVNSRLSTELFHRRFGFELRPWQEAARDVIARVLSL
jgi:dTDP-4-dehydrorhamnose reductase